MASSFHVLVSRLKPSFGVSYFPRCEFPEPRQAKKQIVYSSAQLRSLRYSFNSSHIDQAVHQTLKDHGTLKPFRGCCAGRAVKAPRVTRSLNIRTCQQIRRICISDQSRRTSRDLVQLCRCPIVTQSNKEFGLAISPKIDE